jgi:putative endonuclease
VTFVYILECSDDSYYTGWTTNLDRRVADHNAGRAARYTRSRRPVRLVYWEECADRRSAQQRELALKRLPRARKSALVADFASLDLS